MPDNQVKLIVTAIDNTKTAFSGMQNSLKSLGSSAMNLQNLFRGLLYSAPFLALTDMIKKTANAGEELLKMSKQTGITVENLSKLKYAAEISETSLESLNVGMRAFSNALAGTNDEGKDTTLLLKSLGVTAKDPFEALQQVAKALQGINDASAVSAISVDLFGKSGRELIPLMLELSEALEKAKKNANIFTREQAEQADAFNDNITTFKTNLQGLYITLVNDAMPALNRLFKYTTEEGRASIELENINRLLKEAKDLLEPKGMWQGFMALIFPGGTEGIQKEIDALEKRKLEILQKYFVHGTKGMLEGTKGPAPSIPWDTKKIEDHFKGIWDSAEKGLQELAKTINEPIKEQLDNLAEYKAALLSTYNEAIAKAKEYADVAKQAGEASKGMRDYLEGRKIAKLSPEAGMEAEAEAVKRGYLKGTTLEDYQAAFQKGQSFLEKYTGQAGRTYETQVSQIEGFMSSIASSVEDIKKTNEGMAQTWQDKADSMFSVINTITTRIDELQNKLVGMKVDIDVTESLNSITNLSDKVDALFDKIKNAPEMVIESKIAASPAVPFTQGIENMKEQLASLPSGADFTIDMSSLTGMFERLQRLSGLAQTERLSDIGWGIAKSGRAMPWAGELAGKMQSMMDNLFNVGMVQAFSGVLSQLHGHEKIDSMLQDLIEGYLGNIRSFQGLTSPIEFQKPSFIQVHTGEKLYPAGKTENVITFSNSYSFGDIGSRSAESLAKQIDKVQADMIKTGRSQTIKEIKKKIRNN